MWSAFDFKHLIDFSKMRFFHSVSTSSTCILRCWMSKALRSSTVTLRVIEYFEMLLLSMACVNHY